MAYEYKPIQKRILPTIEEALAAYAKSMKSENDRDPRPLLAIEEHMPTILPRIGGHISARTEALNGFDWALRPRKNAPNQAAEQAAAAEMRVAAAIDSLNERHVDDIQFGHSAMRITWELDTGGWVVADVQHVDASDLEPRSDRAAFPGGVARLTEVNRKLVREPLSLDPMGDTMEVSYVVGRWGRGVGGVNKMALFYEILGHMNLLEWVNFNERIKGMPVSRFREGAGPETIDTAKAAVTAAGSAQGVVITDDVQFELMRMVDGLGKESYPEFMERLDKRVEHAYRGNAGTAELPTKYGSYKAIAALQLVGVDILFGDMRRMRAKINRQLLRQDWYRNVSQLVPRELPYELTFITEDQQDTEANARVLEILGRAGYTPDIEEVKRKTGWETLTFAKPQAGLL